MSVPVVLLIFRKLESKSIRFNSCDLGSRTSEGVSPFATF